MRKIFVPILILLLAACQTVPQNEGAPAKVSDVVLKIKADLAAYQQYDAQASAAGPLANACGGRVGFNIDNVKIALTTQTDNTGTYSGSATLPVGSATLTPSLTYSQEQKGTQTLTFSLYPKAAIVARGQPIQKPPPPDADTYPIAAALQQLRDGLLEASYKAPCVSLIPTGTDPNTGKPVSDPGGTFAFGFTVTNTATEGGTLKFIVFSLGATESQQHQAANAITVTFKALPGSAALY
jgi:hypothetical protein